MAVNTGQQKRSGAAAFNRTQVGLICGFVGIGLLMAFGAGFIVGARYQATEYITPAASHVPVSAAKTPTWGQDLTFYSTLDPELPARSTGSATTPRQVGPSPRSVITAPPAATVALPAPKAPPQPGPRQGSPSAPQSAGVAAPTQGLAQPSETGYSIQVGSFRAREEAERLRQRLTQKGHAVWVLPSVVVGQGIWYRVRVGSFPDRATADRAAQRLATQERVSVMVTEASGM
jgi:cell division septation protein DedD